MRESKRASVWRHVAAAVILLGLCGLVGCASRQPVEPPAPVEPPPPPPPPPAPEPPQKKVKKRYGKPYVINGKTYRPLLSVDFYAEKGVASWYGSECHGKDTACGQAFDMYALTAAHKILPLSTWVQVTNLENNQSIVLQINDRGPFVSGRVIDLSYAAAQSLGMTEKGVAPVTVETLGPAPSPPADRIKGTFYVQVGSFLIKDNADALHARMQALGYPRSRMVKAATRKGGLWRVQAGPFETLATARSARTVLTPGYPKAFVLLAGSLGPKPPHRKKTALDTGSDPFGPAEELSLDQGEPTIVVDADGTVLVDDYEETTVVEYGQDAAPGDALSEAEAW